MESKGIAQLVGKTLNRITASDEHITFWTVDGGAYEMFHDQDCCESVYVEDVNGDWEDIVGSPILVAEERVSVNGLPVETDPDEWYTMHVLKNSGKRYHDESCTWTFYRIATIKGGLDIRWYGTSNGYYSESVTFRKIENDPE